MEQKGSQSIQKSSKPLPIPKNLNDYSNYLIPERWWEISYYKKKFYLTTEERNYFLRKLNEGARIIQVGALTLTDRFEYIHYIGSNTENEGKSKPEYEWEYGKDKEGRSIAWPKRIK